jgi:hypothetical protein
MPLNNIILMTFGSWEKTNLLNNNEEVLASRLFLHITCDSMQGGIKYGSDIEHFVTPSDDPDTTENEETVNYPLFPGRFEADLNIPTGGTNIDGTPTYMRNLVVVENSHPDVSQDFTRVWYQSGSGGTISDDDEVTDSLLELLLQLDYPNNIVRGYIRLYKRPLLGGDSEILVNLM